MAASAGTFVLAHTGAGTSLTSGSIGTTNVGDVLILTCSDGGSGTPAGSDSKTNTGWTAAGTSQTDATTGVRGSMLYAENIANAGATHTLTVSYGATNNISILAGSILGTAGAGAVDTGSLTQVQDSASPYTNTSNAPAQADNYWLSLYVPPDTGLGTETYTIPSTWASLAQVTDRNTSYCHALAGKAINSASAQSVTWADSSTTGNRQLKIVAIKSAVSGVTAALTGVAGTSSVGTLGLQVAKALTGNAATAAVGTVGASLSKALTGNSATGSPGTVAPSTSKALTGNQATGASGTVAPSISTALTGSAATASVGTVTPALAKALTGNQATGGVGTVGPNVTVALPGVQATGEVGSVTAIAGYEVAVSGVAGTGQAGTLGPAIANGLTGNAATGSPGTVAPSTSKALTGAEGTGAAGTLSPSVSVGLTGVAATGAVGTVSVDADATQALTGVAATGAVGTVAPSVSVALTGVSATGAVGSVTAGQLVSGVEGTGSAGNVGPGTSKAITGNAATSAVGSLSPDVSIALSGVEATGEVGNVAFVGGDLTIGLTGVQATGAIGVLQVAGDFSDIAAAVWSYMLSNGKTAGQNVVEIRSMLDTLTPGFWDFVIEGTFTAADLLRVIAAVQAGKSTITALGAGAATVEFRAADDSETRVTATMAGSERTEVTLNAN